MTDNNNNTPRTPQLRFPGFTGDWEAPTISEIFDIRNGYTPSKRIPEYWEGGTIPWFRMEDIRENGGILADAIQHISPLGVKGKGLFKKNSIILATTATIGIHAMLIADSLANQQFTNFSIRESLSHLYSPMYIYYAFFGIDEWCKKNTNAGGLLSVNMPALLKQPFPTPTLAEQQKIADCLSSLDEEIAAEEQKTNALKDHKKGLMQQLFPTISNEQLAMSNEQLAMSNCVPKLRFPGFEGEWEASTISDIFEIRNGYTPSKRISEYWEGGTIPWFRMEDIRENGGILADAIQHITPLGVKGKGLFKKNSIILATTATIGIHAMLIADSLANQRFTNFSIRESLKHLYSPIYVYYAFFGIDEWCKKNTNAGGLLSVNMPSLLKQPFPTPTLAEQQKIADCLSELDEELAAQQQKVEALKEHKKGLMQKMFPKISN